MKDRMTPEALDHGAGEEPNAAALSALVDGGLDADERRAVIAHLAGCRRCREIVAALARPRSRPASVLPAGRRAAMALAASVTIAAAAGVTYWATRQGIPPAASPVASPADTRPAPGTASPAPPPPVSAPVPARPASPPPDRPRAVGERAVAGKQFRLVAGEWIDAAYRTADLLPAVDVTDPAQVTENRALAPFAALGSRFTVVVDGTVYRVSLPPRQP